MPKKKFYNIQLKRQNEKDGVTFYYWYNPVECQNVNREFIKGYITCMKSYYPSYEIRVRDAETNLIIEEVKGNKEVKIK